MGVEHTVGRGETFVALGKAWTISPIGPGLRAKFSEYCKVQALDDLRKLKDFLEPQEYRDDRSLLYARINAGEYSWGTPLNPEGMGDAVRVMLGGEEGKLKLLQLLLEPAHGLLAHDKLFAILADAPEEMDRALRAAMNLPTLEAERAEDATSQDPFPGARPPTTRNDSTAADVA